MNCLGSDNVAARIKTNMFMPQVAKIAVVTGKNDEQTVSKDNEANLTMSRNSTKPRDKRNFETTLPYNLSKAGIVNFCLLKFPSSRRATVFERT